MVVVGASKASGQAESIHFGGHVLAMTSVVVEPEYVPGRILLILSEGAPVTAADAEDEIALSHLDGFQSVADAMNVRSLRPLLPRKDRGPRWEVLNRYFSIEFDGPDPASVVAAYSELPDVETATLVPLGQFAFEPNDRWFDLPGTFEGASRQWYLHEAPGIDAPRAWDFEVGDSSVVVAVVDTGLKYIHWELGGEDPPSPDDPTTTGNVWVNRGEIPANGIDDDANGYVDDTIGWDFDDSDNDPDDAPSTSPPYSWGHGTNIAGVISGLSHNHWPIAGIAGGTGDGSNYNRVPGASILACRVADLSDAYVAIDRIIQAFVYLGDLRASGENLVAVNCSFGFYSPVNPHWGEDRGGPALDYLIAQDVLVVAAAMNFGDNNPIYWPAQRADVLTVGATDSTGTPADFSNYGSWVDVAAPGVDMMMPAINPDDPSARSWYVDADGTSFAAPVAAGIAALAKSYDPALTRQQLFDLIVNNTTPYEPTKDVGAGIVNAWLALQSVLDEVVIDHECPTTLTDPAQAQPVVAQVTSIGGGSIPSDGVEILWRVNGGSFDSTVLTPSGDPDTFVSTLPPQPWGTTVDYYLTARNDEGQLATDPADAPAHVYTYRVGDGFEDDMEGPPTGWYLGSSDEGNGAPVWEWADPEGTEWDGTPIQPEDDHTEGGTRCWVTGATAGTLTPNDYDVEGGRTILYSPRFDLTGASDVVLSYWYYYTKVFQWQDPDYEPKWRVEITNDGGSSWLPLYERLDSTDGWEFASLSPDSLFDELGTVQLRFSVEDHRGFTFSEGLLDDFQLVGVFDGGTSDAGLEVSVARTSLERSSPNPFGAATSIRFQLEQDAAVTCGSTTLEGG